MSTLYELTEGYAMLLDMMDDVEADEQTILDTLESIEGEIEDKADGYAKVIADTTALVDSLKKEIDRLTARKRTAENNIDRLKKVLQQAMELTGKRKFKTDLFNFTIAKSAASLMIEDGAELPEAYIRIKKEPDKTAIKEALKNGELIEGCSLVQKESLRIK
jgi:hypothetical protein